MSLKELLENPEVTEMIDSVVENKCDEINEIIYNSIVEVISELHK